MWQLDHFLAQFEHSLARVNVNAASPEVGLTLTLANGSTTHCWTIAQLAACPLVECYSRDNDIVATYEPSSDFPFRSQVYWSVIEQPEALALEMAISVQTDLLDTHPIVVVSGADAATARDTIAIDNHSLAKFGFAGTTSALLMTVHPTDVAGHVAGENQWSLFSHFLEKGVIRRARLFAALMPTGDLAIAADLYRRFRDQPLPLTV